MTKKFGTRSGYISGGAGNLFVFELVPESPILGTVLIIPPFAEEMNRSRRMLNLQGRQLVAKGYRVLMPDLHGTGDSAGDFSDARWDIWLEDLAVVTAAVDMENNKPVSVLALRLGALLALDALSRNLITADKLVLWSPCVSGKQFLTRFLRIRLLASMIREDGSTETVASLRSLLQQGETVEVAGYSLPPDLVQRIDSLELQDLAKNLLTPVYWFEVLGEDGRPFPVYASRVADELIDSGIHIEKKVVSGPQFWATPEIAICPDLLTETTALMTG